MNQLEQQSDTKQQRLNRICTCDKIDTCPRCKLYHTDDSYNRLWGGPGVPNSKTSKTNKRNHNTTDLPCIHLGKETGETRQCPSCHESVRIKLRECGKHHRCTTDKEVAGVTCCKSCPSYAANNHAYIAPLNTDSRVECWQGRCTKKPWHYEVSVSLPHLNTLEELKVCIELLRLQTIPVYFLVVDTGSSIALSQELEKLRSDDLEIHYIRGHGYIQSSAPVSTAMDVSMALCRTEYLYCTHTDVFARRQDLVSWLLEQCNADTPVVGYGMSDRSWATNLWQDCIGHQCLMLHMPTIRNEGISWNMEQAYHLSGWQGKNAIGWPDTETGFGLDCKRKGIVPKLIGREVNHVRFIDDNIDHARTYTGAKTYLDENATRQKDEMMSLAISEARIRIEEWSR